MILYPLSFLHLKILFTSIMYFYYINLSQELFGTKEHLLQSVRGATIAQSAYWLGCGLNEGVTVPFLEGTRVLSLVLRSQTGCGIYPTSYTVGTRVKVAGTWSWPVTFIWCQGEELGKRYCFTPHKIIILWFVSIILHWAMFLNFDEVWFSSPVDRVTVDWYEMR